MELRHAKGVANICALGTEKEYSIMRVSYNATAMVACNILNKNDKALSLSTQKLSSGYSINRAKDNPSGYALSRKMREQIASLSQASDNASTGIDIIETADGALAEVQEMLQRLNELCVQSANGTLTTADRSSLDTEVQELKEEIQRVADDTEFNGKALLDGTFSLRGYTSDIDVKVQNYAKSIDAGEYTVDLTGFLASSYDTETGYILTEDASGTSLISSYGVTVTDSSGTAVTGIGISAITDNQVTITGDNNFSLTLTLDEYISGSSVTVDLTGIGAMSVQVGANEGQTIDITIQDTGLTALGITSLDALTEDSATAGIQTVSDAIQNISYVRSQLGAYQNRLESTEKSNDATGENMTSALSTIVDVDMAEEYSNYATYQVLTQATTSVLAQANKRPADVLQLLQ